MSQLSHHYEPQKVEEKWYATWIQSNAFSASVNSSKEAYCVMIPPPNVTGILTMGHVLNNTIQDILVRRARQLGKEALWLPGTDHAGIATQTKVEAELRKEGKTKNDLGREAFLERAKVWRDKHGGIIIEQLKKLGASCDWSRNVHTLDADYSNGVLSAFVKLYERGYIYRGKRMVNWCPKSLTALSDEEVTMKLQKSTLYHVRYQLVNKADEFITIATTRPETIMADTAIAVHPSDERYKHLIGQLVWRPLNKAQIPIIADEAAQPEFGSGALKVTPAHDKVDFEIGQRHKLPFIDLLNPDASLNEHAGAPFTGLDRFEARKLAAKLLEEGGHLVKTEAYENNVGYSERADVPIEPRLSEQWFLKYPKIEEAKKAVRESFIKFWPERWSKTYLHWLENIQDWCVSRQLWWGHRIPVWYKKNADRQDPANWHVSLTGPSDPQNWEQDEDVLDTWASSWLWPFATLGWLDSEEEKKRGLHYFYPTSDLVTGPDIIFFWVARMIIAGLEFMGPEKKQLSDQDIKDRIPFKNVYFTGIIRDHLGRKMSKSLGNSPDPLDLISKYGADGLRFGIILSAPQGQDILFSEERVQLGRNFCNKLWNACRFRQISGELFSNANRSDILARINTKLLDIDDFAILGRLAQTIESTQAAFAEYHFSSALQGIYTLFWTDYCDWYLEVSKSKLQSPQLAPTCLAIQDLFIRELLVLLHPFIPFITEELWADLGYSTSSSAFLQSSTLLETLQLPAALKTAGIIVPENAITEVALIREFTTNTRSLKAQYNLSAKRDVSLFFIPKDELSKSTFSTQFDKLIKLIGAKEITCTQETKNMPAAITPLGTVYLDISTAIDTEAEKIKLAKELEKLEKIIISSQSKLADETFTQKAPPHIIEGAKKQLEGNIARKEELKRLIAAL